MPVIHRNWYLNGACVCCFVFTVTVCVAVVVPLNSCFDVNIDIILYCPFSRAVRIAFDDKHFFSLSRFYSTIL